MVEFQTAMKLLDRIRDQEIVRTNSLGAETKWRVGQQVEWEGRRYRVTRQRVVHTVPWTTIIVFGRQL